MFGSIYGHLYLVAKIPQAGALKITEGVLTKAMDFKESQPCC